MSERLSMAGNAQSAPSQELIQFLKEKKLEKYAASICIDQSICESHASGCSQLTALLDMDFVSVAKLSKRCGISVDDQRQLWELVRQRRQPPSIGAKLAQELLSTAEEKEGFTLVSLPFEEKEHCLHFNCQEMTGGVYPWSLRAFNAQIPSQYQDEDASTHIRLLVVGQTSAGNAAQINGILNYFLGMEWHDCIRFQVGRQEAGVADTVDVFMLPAIKGAPVKCKLTLIQAPALGESHGLPFDSAVLDKIKGFFREFPQYVESLSGLCCVPSDSADLLDIWCPILGLFGNDTQLSFMLENTQETAVGYPRGATIFNDMSSLTEPRDQNYAGQRCWIEDRKSMETLFQSLVAFDPVLPNPINEIMERREQLEGTLEELGQRIKVLQERTSRIQNWDGETEGDHETTVDGLQVDVSTECLAVLNLQEQVRICNNRLEDIAMYPSAMPREDYLEKVIQHMNPGLECQDKVDSLEKLKRTIELLRDAAMPDYLSILLKDFNQQDTVRAHRNRRFFYSY